MKNKNQNKKRTTWGIVDFPVKLRKKICAIAEIKNITVSALVEEILIEYVNRKETQEFLLKKYIPEE